MRILTPARVTLLMLFVVGGLVAAYVAKNLWASDEAPVAVETRAVPMAVADLKPGTIITEAHLGLGRMPADELSRYPGMLLENRAIVGRVVKQPIQAGTPILTGQLYEPGERPPLQIGKGMRAVSVSLKDTVALVDGRIAPGQYVDVHLTPNLDAQNGARFRGGITLTLFKGVRVLAVNSSAGRTVGGASTNAVTLELTPGQANVMILAGSRGDVTLSYNPEGPGHGGVGVNRDDRATLEEILGISTPKRDASFTTETYRRSSRSTLQFQDGRRVEDTGRLGRNAKSRNLDSPPAKAKRIAPAVPRPERSRLADGPSLSPVK